MNRSPGFWMLSALDLAAKADNRASPNPKVGCVVVKDGRIVGKGFHATFGGPHAEAIALARAGKEAKGSTVFLTLEPCCHSDKKTAPCAPKLVAAGVRKVFVACKDLNPKVSGRGIRFLRKAGIEVLVGLRKADAEALNKPFFTWVRKRRPYVLLKMATTLDGRIKASTPWLSNRLSLKKVQALRSQTDAILVGAKTVLQDNPRLSLRIRGAKQPLRVILDGRLHCPIDSKVFRDPNVIVFCDARAPVKKMNSFREKGISLIRFSSKKVPLLGLLRELAKKNVATLVVEGGSKTASDFLRQRLVDRGLFFVAPFISGTGLPMFENLGELRPVKTKATLLGNNVLIDVEF